MLQSYAQTEFANSSIFFWHVNNTLCVCLYLYYYIFDKLRRGWRSHWNTAWHPTQSLIKISGAHLWLTNHTPHRGVPVYFNEKIYFLLETTQTITNNRVRCSRGPQSCANAHTTSSVRRSVYFAHVYMNQRSYWKENTLNEMPLHFALHISSSLVSLHFQKSSKLILKRKNCAVFHHEIFTYFISRILRTRRV